MLGRSRLVSDGPRKARLVEHAEQARRVKYGTDDHDDQHAMQR